MKVYLAGPMRGKSYYNFRRFDTVAHDLRQEGFEVISPADLDRQVQGFNPYELPDDHDWWSIPEGFDLEKCVNEDIAAIMECDGIYLLEGWEASTGARAEYAVAKWLMKEVLSEKPLEIPLEQKSDTEEVRVVNEKTGGEKGSKLERFDLIPVGPLTALARHYGVGARKYDDDNWRKGYDWKLSYAACQRHLNQFWGGEDFDEETGSPHVISAAWHCFAMAVFLENDKYAEFDSREKDG